LTRESPEGCWLWIGSIHPRGYGRFMLPKQKQVKAHRFSYERHNGPVPDGMVVCHRCDTPACVNPDHLFTDTQAGNIRDAQAKGRLSIGERHRCARLTADKAKAIRVLHKFGHSQNSLAKALGVTQSSVGNVVHGKTWAYVAA
jgi:hypothetical protein